MLYDVTTICVLVKQVIKMPCGGGGGGGSSSSSSRSSSSSA